MLARRPYSVAGMRRALERKFGGGPATRQAITRLRELGLLDDQKFAEQYASSLARHRGFGRARIARELKAQLVDYQAIDAALDRAFEETDENESLQRALDKKLRALRRPLSRARLASLCQSLARLGFRPGDIMKAVRERPELRRIVDGDV
jgi:regulatory protein